MDVDRKQILASCLDIIEGISDKEYQKRIWIRGEGPEVDDFDETVCNFFQDGDGIIKDYKEFGITEHQYRLLVKFREVFDKFVIESKHYPSPYFPDSIDTPEWGKIMEMAKKVLVAFNYQKTSK